MKNNRTQGKPPARILIVPPDLLSESSKSSLLARRMVDLRAAESAESALEQAAGFQPELVVFSSQLPEMGPVAFSRRLRDMWMGRRSLRSVYLGARESARCIKRIPMLGTRS